MTDQTPEQEAPMLRVINADATAEEVAALVAVFAALGQAREDAPERPRSVWSDPVRGVRRTSGTTHHHGLGGWRASGLPR